MPGFFIRRFGPGDATPASMTEAQDKKYIHYFID